MGKKQKLLCGLISLVIILSMAVVLLSTVVEASPATEIRDWYDLDAIRNNLDGDYILMNDLDSTTAGYAGLAGPIANGGKGWQPIGSLEIVGYEFVDSFTGTFDGQGYEIRDLFINRPDESEVGLFGSVVGGVIENAEMVDADVTGDYGVGILVGATAGTVSHSSATGDVTGYDYVGGLVGYSYYYYGIVSNGTVGNCSSAGSVNGHDYVGGLVGENDGDVSNSYATGSVYGYDNVGGLVGWSNDGTVDSSYSTGGVTGVLDVGGLVGLNVGNVSTVSNCYATGSVYGGWQVGGLVGFNDGTVDSSYSTGFVTGGKFVGGLVGYNGGTVDSSFWDTQTSGQGSSDGGTGKTTAQMKDISTFTGAGWDIIAVDNPDDRNTDYVWNIVDDVTYPFLTIGKTGDVNNDDYVNILDMILIGQYWGQTGSPGWIPEDVKEDGAINVLDMIIIGQHWTG
jgi:hypothetical protein